jgi:hypothetical protein
MSPVLVPKKLLDCKLARNIRGRSCITLQSDAPIQLFVKIQIWAHREYSQCPLKRPVS